MHPPISKTLRTTFSLLVCRVRLTRSRRVWAHGACLDIGVHAEMHGGLSGEVAAGSPHRSNRVKMRRVRGMAGPPPRHPLLRDLVEVVCPNGVHERVAVRLRVPDQLEAELAAAGTGDRSHAADVGGVPGSDQVDADLALRRQRVRCRASAPEALALIGAARADDLDVSVMNAVVGRALERGVDAPVGAVLAARWKLDVEVAADHAGDRRRPVTGREPHAGDAEYQHRDDGRSENEPDLHTALLVRARAPLRGAPAGSPKLRCLPELSSGR